MMIKLLFSFKSNSNIFDISKFNKEYEQPLKEIDLLPIFHSLRFNKYFTNLIFKNYKIEKKEVIQGLAELFKYNNNINSLTLSGISTNVKEAFVIIFDSMVSNKECKISKLDLSNSNLEDKGILSLATFLKKTNNQITYLDISNTGCTPKSLNVFLNTLRENPNMSSK